MAIMWVGDKKLYGKIPLASIEQKLLNESEFSISALSYYMIMAETRSNSVDALLNLYIRTKLPKFCRSQSELLGQLATRNRAKKSDFISRIIKVYFHFFTLSLGRKWKNLAHLFRD